MATAVPAATESQENVKKPPGGGCWHKGVGSRQWREHPDLVFPRGGPRAAHQLFQRRFRRPDQLLHGHLCAQDHPPITQDEAEAYLAQDLVKALNATLRYCPVLATEHEGRLAAVVDFTFNLGAGRLQTSTLRRRINQQDWPSAALELRRWIYGGGKILPGLVTRRDAEIVLLLRNA